MSALEPLVDTHCHLTWNSFDADLDAVVARMNEEGVMQAVVVATNLETSLATRELCRDRAGLFPTAGIHPNDVPEDVDAALAEVETLLTSGDYIAVGETGIDYYRDWCPVERQRISFEAHAKLARKLDLPLIVHIRDQDGSWDAFDDVQTILERVDGVRGVIHCYTGDARHAEGYRRVGFYISFSGVVTFKNGAPVRDVAAATPLDRLLVETDAPFLAPVPWRGKRNEPGYVAATARCLAEVHGIDDAEFRRRTTANARALFRLPDLSGSS